MPGKKNGFYTEKGGLSESLGEDACGNLRKHLC